MNAKLVEVPFPQHHQSQTSLQRSSEASRTENLLLQFLGQTIKHLPLYQNSSVKLKIQQTEYVKLLVCKSINVNKWLFSAAQTDKSKTA